MYENFFMDEAHTAPWKKRGRTSDDQKSEEQESIHTKWVKIGLNLFKLFTNIGIFEIDNFLHFIFYMFLGG